MARSLGETIGCTRSRIGSVGLSKRCLWAQEFYARYVSIIRQCLRKVLGGIVPNEYLRSKNQDRSYHITVPHTLYSQTSCLSCLAALQSIMSAVEMLTCRKHRAQLQALLEHSSGSEKILLQEQRKPSKCLCKCGWRQVRQASWYGQLGDNLTGY